MTNEYENTDGVTHAATEVIDGVTYEVVYLPGNANSAQTQALINQCNQNKNGNYRYILQNDWDMGMNKTNIVYLYGNAVILDLNGCQTKCSMSSGNYSYFVGAAKMFEITDSSGSNIGKLDYCPVVDSVDVLIYSGNIYCSNNFNRTADQPINVIIRGGRELWVINWTQDREGIIWTIPPYMSQPKWNMNGGAGNRIHPLADYFAVSTTEYASGIYNYAYGYQWEISVAELSNLAVPTDKTYYLWGRNDGDAWYKYLGLTCTDGVWRNAV